MARIRSLKPEFWTAEQVMDCTPITRLAFIGMWNFCDDAGIHPASPKTLKAEVFPSDDITTAQVSEMVAELIAQGLIEQYEVEGRAYWVVTGWHHQKIDQPTYKHPTQDGTIPEGAARRRSSRKPSPSVPPSATPVREVFGEQPQNVRGVFTPGEERRGEESTGVNLTTEERGSTTERVDAWTESRLPPQPHHVPPVTGTRKGYVCGLLRAAGMQDSAPHHLTDEAWSLILSKRTDEEIVEFARSKMDSMPNQRIGLKYIAPGLLQDPQTIATGGGARASPGVSRQAAMSERNRQAAEQAKASIRAAESERTIDAIS